MRERSSDIFLLLGGGALLLLGCLLLLFFPQPQFSERENRMLAAMPRYSVAAMIDGSYAAGFESYATERIPYRNEMRSLRAVLELAMGKREIGGVVLCRDGSLAARPQENKRTYSQNLAALQRLLSQSETAGVSSTVAVVPRRIEMADKLPYGCAATLDKSAYQRLRDALPSAVVADFLTVDHWYRTDHHLTSEGAYALYAALGAELGYSPLPKSAFSPVTVCEDFFGTADAAAGIPHLAPDKISLWRYAGDEDISVSKDGVPAAFGLYDLSKLGTRDKYSVFLGGNDAVTVIDSSKKSADDPRPTLFLIKDSFANALIPFLARHFRIVAADPRYGIIDTAAHLASADRLLILSGMATLGEAPLARGLR